VSDAHKIGFDDNVRPVPSVEFDFDAIEARERDAEIRNLKADVEFFKDRLADVIRCVRDSILLGNPTPKQAGRRAYYFAQLVSEVGPFESQAQLAKHLGVTPGRISQELNSFLDENPLIKRLSRLRAGKRLNAPRILNE
jgi:hypothetical protein